MKIRQFTLPMGATALAIALPLLAAERLAVKTGLWENTVTMHITGVKLPAEQLAQMSPEQRAQMEQLMKQMGVGAPRTVTEKSCITDKDLDGNAFRDSLEQPGQSCEYKQVASTSKRQEWTFQCKTQGTEASGRMVMEALGNSRVRGSMQAKMPEGNMDMKFEAQWQSADCAGATR